MLDDNAIERFAHGFFGYGSWAAPVWIIGMEEGGGGSIEEVSRRMTAWEARGRRELEDLGSYHEAIGVTRHVGEKPALQPTWSKMIHVFLGANSLPANSELVRNFQSRELGRANGDTCILELLPLPSPNVRTWLYASSKLAYLSDRERYRRHIAPRRIERIREHIRTYHPRAVVFLGLAYMSFWQQIAGREFICQDDAGARVLSAHGTTFVVARHPASRGVTNAYFREVGRLVGRKSKP